MDGNGSYYLTATFYCLLRYIPQLRRPVHNGTRRPTADHRHRVQGVIAYD